MVRRLGGSRKCGLARRMDTVSNTALGAELSHVVAIDRIGPEGLNVTVVANDEARTALAGRLGIPAVLFLDAQLRLREDPAARGQFLLEGHITAEVEQSCVVTLEPVRQQVDEAVVRRFAPVTDSIGRPVDEADDGEAEWLDPEADDPPDPIIGGVIDIGAVVVEELALGLDPYPRRQGADIPERYRLVEEEVAKGSPFAALARLKSAKKD